MSVKKILAGAVSYILIVFGALLSSFSVVSILMPNDAIDYGTAGIAIVLSKLTGINLSVCVALVFAPFLAGSLVFLGKKFFFKVLVGSAAYTLGLELFAGVDFVLNTEHFIAVAFGGAILGIGLSLVLSNGGCIDGSEILANIVLDFISTKTGRRYSMSPFLIGFNIVVYGVVFFAIDRTVALMSLLVYVVATVVVGRYTNHFEGIKKVTIIVKKDEGRIVAEIKKRLNKTCTIVRSKGAIAGENKTLICYIGYFELQKMCDILTEFPGTFSTISSVDKILITPSLNEQLPSN